MEMVKERGLQAISLVALIALWQALAVILDTSALPPPVEVAARFYRFVVEGDAFPPLYSTLTSTVFGFMLGFAAGIAYGVISYLNPRFNEIFGGLFNVTLFTPTLIIIFLGLVMLGHDNRLTVILVTGFAIFPDMAVYMRDALKDLDQDIMDMAASFKVGFLGQLRDIYIPYLIPPMLASGRIGFSIAWKIAFLTEVFGFPEGLGWQVRSAYTVYNMTSLLAWLAVFIVTILIIEQATRMLERAVVKW